MIEGALSESELARTSLQMTCSDRDLCSNLAHELGVERIQAMPELEPPFLENMEHYDH